MTKRDQFWQAVRGVCIICVVLIHCKNGLGYVGLPLAVAFAKVADVVGFDISREKVEQYHKGIDVTKEVGDKAVQDHV